MTIGFLVSPTGTPDSAFPQPNRVEVDEGILRPASFSLSYPVNVQDGDLFPVSHQALGPDCPVILHVVSDDKIRPLLKGMILRQSMNLSAGGNGTLEVSGADATAEMNREFHTKVWTDVTDASIVEEVLPRYGFSPTVDPTDGVHSEAKFSFVQRETDLQLVYRLARRNGCWFWLEYDPTGTLITAHFQKPPVTSEPSAILSIRADNNTVEDFSLSWDTDRPTAVSAMQLDVSSLSLNDGSVDRSPLPCLAQKSLSDIVPNPRTTQLAVPVADQADLQARAEALLVESGWFVRVRIVAALSKLKTLVRAHTVVNLDGAGSRHSGKYLVSRVLHNISSGEDLMTIDLVRNGWN